MRSQIGIVLSVLVCASLACQTVLAPFSPATRTPRPPATAASDPTRTPARDTEPAPATPVLEVTVVPGPTLTGPSFTDGGVRLCDYIPGVSIPAQMPPEVVNPPTATPFPTPTPPLAAPVDADQTDRQLRIFRELWSAVRDNYVYEDFRGRDWDAIGDRYEALIRQGLTEDAFYDAMRSMVFELGDEHSSFLSPQDVQEQEAELAGTREFVGIGAMVLPLIEEDRASIISIFPGSPAEEAGLRSHDAILSVDGGPVWDENGQARTLGVEGTQVTIVVQRPGEPEREMTLTRRRVTGNAPIDYCLVPNTRIGYIFFPTFFDETIDEQTRAALERMVAEGPLEGLILDNRQNGGGISTVADPIMGLFMDGLQGYFVSRADRRPLRVEGEDVAGSQSVPLVVLVGEGTASYGEIVSGVLRVSGRAQIVGQTTDGNVEVLWGYEFEDGSRAWIAQETFEPLGESAGIWEDTGIIPDVEAPSRWDLFSEATDPGLAAAVRLLQEGGR